MAWLTGLPAAGKSTVARLAAQELAARGRSPVVLDGDEFRRTASSDLGFSAADREENVRRAAARAQRLSAGGSDVIVALISPFRRGRDDARRRLGPQCFIEVHVDASLEACMRRDPKGLYARALAGEIADFTGISSPYEAPTAPDLVLATEAETPAESARALVAAFEDLRVSGEHATAAAPQPDAR